MRAARALITLLKSSLVNIWPTTTVAGKRRAQLQRATTRRPAEVDEMREAR